MTNKKISALTAATTPLGGTELVPVVQGGVTDNVSVANLTIGRAVGMLSMSAVSNAAGSNILGNFSTSQVSSAGSAVVLVGGLNSSYGSAITGYYNYSATLATRLAFSTSNSAGTLIEAARFNSTGSFSIFQATTAAAPTYVKGAMYFDTTLAKLRIGGATAWETVTSI